MAVRVIVEPEQVLTARKRNEVAADIDLFLALRSRLELGELRTLRSQLADVAAAGEAPESERAMLGFRALLGFFSARRELLADAVTAPHAAQLLGVSRQTPLNRVRENTLLAVLDRGAYRFPMWQFDPQGEDGVVPGLPAVLRALEPQQPFAKLVWLRRPNPALDGREPLEALRANEVDRVVAAARAASTLP